MSLPRLALALVLPLTLAAPARASQMTDATPEQIEALLAKLSRMPINARVDVLSKFFVGTPYADFPLGEGGSGPEPQARFRLDAVDCQTFVETVLALANSKSIEQAKLVLDDIRYSRLPASFATRNHFTEAQWLPSNIEKGYLREAVGAIDGHAPETSLVLKRAEWSQVEGLKRLESAEIPEGKFPIKYLPINDFKKRSKSIETGSIIL
ncbi:MAG: DUF1460 domain-containing protein, partial [Deltaproteobacteria bacterium]|nr:DUF1460 domain-containing protein [Deltaproteobacteria bacterium]